MLAQVYAQQDILTVQLAWRVCIGLYTADVVAVSGE